MHTYFASYAMRKRKIRIVHADYDYIPVTHSKSRWLEMM